MNLESADRFIHPETGISVIHAGATYVALIPETSGPVPLDLSKVSDWEHSFVDGNPFFTHTRAAAKLGLTFPRYQSLIDFCRAHLAMHS